MHLCASSHWPWSAAIRLATNRDKTPEMITRLVAHPFFRNWLKAFFLSPGILFLGAYLCVWLLTGLQFNRALELELKRLALNPASHGVEFSIGSLRPGSLLDSVVLNEVELRTPDRPEPRCIGRLELPCPELQQLLLNREAAEAAARAVGRHLFSLNGSSFPGVPSGSN